MPVEVWYAIPSANPEACRRNLPLWREMGYKVAVLQNWERAEIPADLVVWSDEYTGWSNSINILSRDIVPRSAQIVVSGGDDMQPDPNFTAQEIAEQFMERFPDTFGVMQPQGDEFMEAKHYCGSPWLGRRFIDTMYEGRGPMWGGYRHNWSDNELFWVSRCLHALWQRDDLSQHHDHFTRHTGEKPEYWRQNVERFDRLDVRLFVARSWQQFPGHAPRGYDREFDSSVLNEDQVRLAESHFWRMYGGEIFDIDPKNLPGRHAEIPLICALKECKLRGLERVAIYGGGRFTRSGAAALLAPPVEVLCIIDDDPAAAGTRMWNYPVVSREAALAMRPDAVILSSDTIEDQLWRAAQVFRDAGAVVLRQSDPNAPLAKPGALRRTLVA